MRFILKVMNYCEKKEFMESLYLGAEPHVWLGGYSPLKFFKTLN